MKKALFIDRDGTIIVEPPVTEQVDTLERLEFLPAAIGSLASIAELDYELVIASNQDGLGTESYPEERFYTIHNKMLDTLKGEGVIFDDQLIGMFLHESADGGFITTSVIITAIIVIIALVAGMVILLKVSGKNKAAGLVPGAILMTAGLFLLSTTTDIHVILIGIVPTLVGNLVMGIQFNAALKDFIPEGKAGLFQGIRMIFTVLIPMVLGPMLGDLACRNSAVTYMNEYGVATIVPSKSMFVYAAIVSVFVLIPLFFLIKKGFEVEESTADTTVA